MNDESGAGSTSAVASGVTLIDSLMGGVPEATATYLLDAPEPALVETGPTTSLGPVASALEDIGIAPSDLAHVFVTHIHVDHAGGAGALAERFPDATIWVHERGARHLADPGRLEASATRAFGEEHMSRVFGPILPVPGPRIRSIADGEVVDLGTRTVTALYSPGHASHHCYFVDSESGALFSGDALGISLPGAGLLRPATPPSDFDLELAIRSMRLVIDRDPPLVLLSHYGPVQDAVGFCTDAIERVRWWAGVVEATMEKAEGPEDLVARLTEQVRAYESALGVPPEVVATYDLLSTTAINGLGMARYLEQRGARTTDDPTPA